VVLLPDLFALAHLHAAGYATADKVEETLGLLLAGKGGGRKKRGAYARVTEGPPVPVHVWISKAVFGLAVDYAGTTPGQEACYRVSYGHLGMLGELGNEHDPTLVKQSQSPVSHSCVRFCTIAICGGAWYTIFSSWCGGTVCAAAGTAVWYAIVL